MASLYKFIGFLLGFYILFALLLFAFQEKILFQPGEIRWDNCPGMNFLGAQTVNESINHRAIHGWRITRANAIGRIFIFHGNGGFACDRVFWLSLIDKLPVDVIFVEYPGYDGTELDYSLLLARGIDFYDLLQKQKALPSIAIGESLGTGLATYLAAERKIEGLVLYASYPSLVKVVRSKLGIFPIASMLKYPMSAEKWAKNVNIPVLLFHGNRDKVIFDKFGQEEALNFGQGIYYPIDGADHNDWTEFFDAKLKIVLTDYILSRLQ